MDKNIGQIHILPPTRRVCPTCAARHMPDEPHLRSSLWYQMRFHQDHGRLPTWTDAARHCSAKTLNGILTDAQKGGILTLNNHSGNEWISTLERLPTKDDADQRGLVLVWHVFQGLMLTGWHQLKDNRFLVYWQKSVQPPDDADVLLKAWDDEMEKRYKKK